MYLILLESGWRLQEIDEMDLIGYIRLQVWREKKKLEGRHTTIDVALPWMAPNI
ncbi:MAG: hypothetical protein IJ523_09705 [Succinivibrionaceae bacterium]|nr:hypothetical protein [Succinivibrionaceae bacterium]